MAQSPTAHTLSLQQTLKSVESNISTYGPGPHTPQQREKLQELNQLKQKLIEQMQVIPISPSPNSPQRTVVNQGSPMTAISMPMTNTSTIGVNSEVQPISISQSPLPTQILPQRPRDDDKILNKRRLQELVKEIDPNEQLDDDVEEMLMQITDDFIESIVGAACNLAKHRNAKVLEVRDLKLHLEKQWNISVPGYGSDEIRTFKKPIATEAHKQRLALIRKATKK